MQKSNDISQKSEETGYGALKFLLNFCIQIPTTYIQINLTILKMLRLMF